MYVIRYLDICMFVCPHIKLSAGEPRAKELALNQKTLSSKTVYQTSLKKDNIWLYNACVYAIRVQKMKEK